MPFADFMKQSLLDPLGMTNSSFDTGLSSSALMAKGYRGRDAEAEPALRDVPAGGLNSSVTDSTIRAVHRSVTGGELNSHGRMLAILSVFDLVRGNDGQFRLNYSLLGIFPIDLGFLGQVGLSRRTVAGRDLLVARVGEQEYLAGQRIEPIADLGSWRRYLGDYEITNLGDDHKFVDHVKLIEEHGYLFVEITAEGSPPGKVLLKPLSDSEGILLGALSDGGETVRVVQRDGEERLLYSGYQFKKIER